MILIEDIDRVRKVFAEVARYASRRTPIEAQKCILIEAADGIMKVSAYDGFKSCSMETPMDGDLLVLVDAQTIMGVLSNLNAAVELTDTENGLRLKSGPTMMTIATRPASEAVSESPSGGVGIKINAHELGDLLSFGVATSRVENGGGEKAAQIVPEYGVIATDSFIGSGGCNILTHIKTDRFSAWEDKRICIQTEHVKSLISFLASLGTEDEVDMTATDSHISVKSPGVSICIRRLEEGLVGKVPLRVLEDTGLRTSSFLIAGDQLPRAIKLMIAVSLPEKKMIRLWNDEGKLGVTQVATERGSSTHSIEGMCDISDEICLDMDRLSVGLSCFGREESVMAKFNDSSIELAVDDKRVLIAGMQS